jgi:hypothetical protein
MTNRTLEDHLNEAGETIDTTYPCVECGENLPAFALVEDGDGWICGNCLIDRARTVVQASPTPLSWDDVRGERLRLLTMSDWTQIADVNDTVSEAWKPVRQALRDVPETHGDPQEAWDALKVIEASFATVS